MVPGVYWRGWQRFAGASRASPRICQNSFPMQKERGIPICPITERMRISGSSGERDSLWACLYCGKEDGDGTRGGEIPLCRLQFQDGPTRLALPEASWKKKWYLLDGHRQRAGTVPKRGGAEDAPRIELYGQSVVILTGK